MRFLNGIVLGVLTFLAVQDLSAVPQMLETVPVESPEGTYTANVEWDDAGFIGRIRMLIYDQGETPIKSVELPQMKPAPANLTWISENWVTCESFVAEQGAAFFYMDVAREKGYLLEILAPQQEGDWIVTYTTNDAVSSNSIHTIARGHSSIFPILLRNLPTEGLSYLSPDFAFLMADAVDSFVQWRQKEKFRELDFLTPVAENPNVGRLAVMAFDDVAEIVYFPQRTTTTREMLALTQRQKLPEDLQAVIKGVDPPKLALEWVGNNGDFLMSGSHEGETTPTELLRGRFEDVSDAPYTGPGVAELLEQSKAADKAAESSKSNDSDDKAEEKSEKSKSSSSKTSSKSKSSSKSSSKKPSRSK